MHAKCDNRPIGSWPMSTAACLNALVTSLILIACTTDEWCLGNVGKRGGQCSHRYLVSGVVLHLGCRHSLWEAVGHEAC